MDYKGFPSSVNLKIAPPNNIFLVARTPMHAETGPCSTSLLMRRTGTNQEETRSGR
jgi:hypothetical protein